MPKLYLCSKRISTIFFSLNKKSIEVDFISQSITCHDKLDYFLPPFFVFSSFKQLLSYKHDIQSKLYLWSKNISTIFFLVLYIEKA